MTLVSLTRVVDESEKISSYPLELGSRGELCDEVPFLRWSGNEHAERGGFIFTGSGNIYRREWCVRPVRGWQ